MVENKPFVFLVVKGFRNGLDRGGMQWAIRAFLEEFKKGEAKLILKLNPAYAMPPQILQQYIMQFIKSDSPEIMANYDNMTQKQLNELYNQCDVLLNPTEGEAFSLPSIEAMACGKSVIATNFGGQTDFITNENGWLIPYKLHEVKHELIYESVCWGRPNLADLCKAMRYAVEHPDEVRKKGELALLTAKNYTWANSAQKALEALKR